MVRTKSRVRKTIVQLAVAVVCFGSLGAAVVAAPSIFALNARSVAASDLQPLAGGPTLQLAKASAGAGEDCVRVTSMVGPDGKGYPTNGMVCGGE